PDSRFIQLFKNDFEFMNKIGTTLGTARFAVIGGDRRSGPKDLSADMATLDGSWRLRRQRDNRRSEGCYTLFELVGFGSSCIHNGPRARKVPNAFVGW